MARSNIKFTTTHKVYANEFIEDSTGVNNELPFDANTNYKVHVKGLVESTTNNINYNSNSKTLTAKEFIEGDG